MAHPHKTDALNSATAKFKAMTSGYQKSSESPSGNKPAPGVMDNGPMKEMPFGATGAKAKPRLDKFARGGKVKGKTDITINVGKPDAPDVMAAPAPMPVPVPAGPPPAPPMA